MAKRDTRLVPEQMIFALKRIPLRIDTYWTKLPGPDQIFNPSKETRNTRKVESVSILLLARTSC